MVGIARLPAASAAGYEDRTTRSRALWLRAKQFMPGGSTRSTVHFDPHPFYAVHAEGSRIWDVDGTERIDFLNNYTSLVLGHRHPAVIEAVREQLDHGNVFGTPSVGEVDLAERLCARIDSFQQVALTTTGTEAVVAAIRAARAFTRKTAIAKVEGGFHGTYDHVNVSVDPVPSNWGTRAAPIPAIDGAGIPPRVRDEVHIFHWNDAESCESVLRTNAEDIAAVIIEPVLGPGGMLAPEPGFLAAVREITSRYGVVLVFDEVFAHRLARGGAQQYFGVQADLVAISKSIGSGFPVGAVGGGREIMSVFAREPVEERVFLSGTFHGNPLSAAAAVATLKALTDDAYAHLDRLGAVTRGRLNQVFAEHGVDACATGVGSLFQIHFLAQPPRNHRDVAARDRQDMRKLHLGLLEHGVMLGPNGLGCVSTATTDEDVASLAEAVNAVLDRMYDRS